MTFFIGTDSDIDFYPAKDPDVIRCQGALQEARHEAEPAQKAWAEFVAAHRDETPSVPFSRHKQRLYDAVTDAAEAVEVAEVAHTRALEAATVKATAAWDAIIRQQFVEDLPAIEAFIALLEKHEARAVEAELAGVNHALSVSKTFITSAEVAGRLDYAKKALGVE